MAEIIGRKYCLKHPGKIIKVFGLEVFLGMLFSKKSLLQRVTEAYEHYGIAMPGAIGNAYKISALIEYRMARLYGKMADRFVDREEVHTFFEELQREEKEHARLMMLCLYSVVLNQHVQFIPSIRDPEISGILRRIKAVERSVDTLTLDEALGLTEELEKGEINTIFDKLLKQTRRSESLIFEEEMQSLENHSRCVPKRIKALRQRI